METHKHDSTDKVVLGFWIYLMTDLIMFGALFATYAVLRGNTFGGPGVRNFASLGFVLVETLILLTSSYLCGLAMLALRRKEKNKTLILFAITLVLGLTFLAMEMTEFGNLIHEGNSWTRSAALSAFFTLLGTHGLHIAVGALWLVVLLASVYGKGITNNVTRQLTLFSMFWHFLDIVWIFIFTIVYLLPYA